MSGAVIRAAVAADLPLLERIHREVRAEIGSAPVAGFAADTEGELLLVAELEGRVRGLVAVFEPGCFVHHLYVERAARGRGVGSALLAAVTARLGGRPWLKVDASNGPARAFYRGRGWIEDPPQDGVVAVRAPAPG